MRQLAPRPPSLVKRFGADRGGNVALLFAVLFALGTVIGAFSVDEGALYLQRRQAQSGADLAAIAAASASGDAFARARATLADAGLIDAAITDAELEAGTGAVALRVDAGAYSADPALAVEARFQTGGLPTNAVRVRLRTRGTLYFAQSWGKTPDLDVEAVASASPQVMFSVGSTLLQLQDGVPNAVLSALLGAKVTLSAASYNGLANAQVGVFGFLDALAQQLNISAGTYGDVLAASADSGAIAKALAASLSGADALAATALAQGIGTGAKVPLGKLFDLGDAARLEIGSGATSGLFTKVSALSLLSAAGAVSEGTHQVALDLAAGVPGLASLTMKLAVGEPAQFAAWFSLGPGGKVARTAQIRLQFVATIGGGLLLSNALIRLPLLLDVAYAEAGVQSAACPSAGAATGSAVIAATPGIARLTLGEASNAAFADFTHAPAIPPVTLINLLLLKVSGSGVADIGQASPTLLAFSATDIGNGTIRQASTTGLVAPLAASLLSHLTLDVSALGIGLPSTATIRTTISNLVAPLAPVLDTTIAATLQALGLKLGVADVRVYGVTCGRAVLVR